MLLSKLLRLTIPSALLVVLSAYAPAPVSAECYGVGVTANTPTGIAGCERWGAGTASHYGPGSGVAMNFCTWVLRHSSGCGSVTITSTQTGRAVTAPVIDFCDCYTGTSRERIIDLEYGVVQALGLSLNRGLYPVTVYSANQAPKTQPPAVGGNAASSARMPDTSVR